MAKQRVLFLCTGNSCRSQMAEAIVNARLADAWEAYSAGTQPAGYVHPLALRVLDEIGIDHAGRSKSVDEYRALPFDLVVTVCDDAAENCPLWLGQGRRVHLGFSDPAKATGSAADVLAVFRQVRADIMRRVPELLKAEIQADKRAASRSLRMSNMTTAAAEYFARVAGEWDNLRASYFGEGVRDAAIARAYLRPEMVVADVGSGTGFIAVGLAPLVAQVYAVDASAAMLEAGKANLAAFGNIEPRLAAGAALPFENAALDAVFANMYLHHCPNPQAAITELVRVLKPGGRLVITDMAQHDHAWLREELADVWLGFAREDLRAWFRAAGLVNIVVDGTQQTCSSGSQSQAGETMADISIFVATGSRRVSGAQAAVQLSYGSLAENSCCGASATKASCCGTVDTAASQAMALVEAGQAEVVLYDTGYTAEQLAAVPPDAAQMSLGCGNPTALASLRPGETVLDIGSGAGIDALYAARRVGPTGRVIGLDMTPAMIERARRNAAAAGLTHVEFRLGQAEAMPVADNIVDIILSNCVINLAEDKGRVFEEAYRVLKPGGRVSISDMVTAGPLPMNLRSDPAQWAGCINGALPEAEYLDLVRQAGFVDVAGQRSLSRGELAGVEVYSLAVSAHKA